MKFHEIKNFLKVIVLLFDLSFQAPTVVQGKRDEAEAVAHRENLVQILLGILNDAAKFGVGPNAADFMPTHETQRYSSLSPDIGRHIYKKKE